MMDKNFFRKQKCRELVERRSACTKVYENEDHTMTAAIYGRPVHFMEDGQWKDYDDTLTESGTEGDVENEAGDLKIKFANKIKEDKTIRIRNAQGDLSWGPENGNKSVRNQTGVSAVAYEEVWEGVDLRYTLAGGSLKEDIILNQLPETGTFSFIYRSVSLHAQADNRGNVVFADDRGEAVFTVSAPYMKDAAGAISTAVHIRLEENDLKGGHVAVIAVEADMEWLSAPERMWPVVIDPVVRTSSSIYDIHDVHVSSWYNTDNFVNSHILKTGYIDGSTLRSYLRFTLPDISPADMVIAAQFAIANYSTSSSERRIDIHKVTGDWNHNTINWNNKPAYDTRVIDYCTFTNSTTEMRLFDITDLVKDWYQNGKNYGLLMKDSTETGGYTEYLSSDCHDDFADIRPCILIQYVNNTGIEDYWTYHSHNVGRAGTGYVNDYNGNQIFIHPTLSMTGNRMPVNLTHVFNSNDRGTNMGYGLGFRLNYHQTIASVTLSGTQYYKQVDGDGTAHYFAYDKDDSKWKDEGNKDRVLTIGTSSSTKYTIKDKEDNQLIFNSSGLLVKVMDANGNTLAVTYSSNKITKLTDGSGRAVTLAYGTDGNLASVTDPAGRVKRFAYTGNRLTSITDVDGAVCSFTYDTASGKGMMLSAADPYGYKITYSYYSQKPYRMQKISESAGSTAGQAITMTYGYNRTTFTDKKGRSESYLFDHAGRTVSVRNDEGYGAAWQYLDSGNNANKLSAASALQYVPVQLLKGITGGLTGWTKYASEATITVTEDSAQRYVGSKSVHISSTALTGQGAILQRVSLIPGKRYVFSAYAKADIAESASNGRLWLQIQDRSGQTIKYIMDSEWVKPGFSGWRRIQAAFTTPAPDNGTIDIYIVARMSFMKGSVWFDGFQLEEGEAASRLNLVQNNVFASGLTGYTTAAFTADDKVVQTGDVAQEKTVLTATVNDDNVYLRKGAGTEFASLAMAAKNTKAIVYGADYDKNGAIWYIIGITIGGTAYTGYMIGQYLTLSVPGASVAVSAIAGGNDLNIRSGPGTGYSSKVQISRGTQMSVNGAGKDSSGVKWYKVALVFNGKEYEGYVSSEYIALYAPSISHGKAADVLNVRKGPGTSFDVKTQLARNGTADIHGRTVLSGGDIWYYVKFTQSGTAYDGYVLSDYLTVTSTDTPKTITVTDKETVPAGNGALGQDVLKIVGDEKNDKRMYQKIFISGKKGDCYMANGWGCAHSVPVGIIGDIEDTNRENRHFGIHINFVSSDGKNDIHYAEFGSDTDEWQFLSAPFVAGQDYAYVAIGFAYCRNANIAYFDGLGLYKEEFGTSFVYDDDGNVVRVTDQAKKSGKFEYDSAGNIKKMIDPKGNNFTYTYDGKHNVLTAKSAANLNYAFTYDAYGNSLTSKAVDPDAMSDASKAMTAKASYTTGGTAVGQYMATQTSPEGKTVSYTWDAAKGQLQKVTDPSGKATAYTYDSTGKVTKVTGKAEVSGTETETAVQYTYGSDRLTKITHNGFDYGFTYNGFGSRTGVSIAGTTVISQTWAANNGLLTKAVYGNGWEIGYTYDSLDRVTAVTAKKDGSTYPICSYIYNKQGFLARLVDGQNTGRSCTYGYDLTGRMCEAVFDDGTAYRYTYDANDCLTKETAVTADGTRTVNRTYDADSRETVFSCGTAKVEKTCDKLGRLQTVKRHNGNHTTTYTYQTATDGGQTGRLWKVTNGSDTFEYGYDDNGNVIHVKKNGQAQMYYNYDARGQLVSEDYAGQDKSIMYFYDAGGNLTEERIYSGGMASDMTGVPYTSRTFAYSSIWKDQLASVTADGVTKSFTYDAIGNLLSDGTRSYTWKNGRQLGSISASGLTAVYTYDASGIRTSKTVNGVKTEYLTAGSRILSEKKGSTWQHYLYDGSGQLMAIRYSGADYYYVRDGLMNIIGFVDSSGNTVVSYSYDSWGKMLGITGSMAATLGADNPFRYKGYYYDEETSLYYIQSRYYDPEICRFISADDVTVLTASPMALTDKNLYAYCDNNPMVRTDIMGKVWETVFDVVSLGFSIAEVAANPYDVGAWAGLVGDTIDLIPFVTGVGETVRGLRFVDKVGNTLEIAKATDFTLDAKKTIKSLNHSNGFTRSTAAAGRKIHRVYKYGSEFKLKFKEYNKVKGIRPDYYNGKTIFELKPYNPRSAKAGIKQLRKYNNLLGSKKVMRLEFY